MSMKLVPNSETNRIMSPTPSLGSFTILAVPVTNVATVAPIVVTETSERWRSCHDGKIGIMVCR